MKNVLRWALAALLLGLLIVQAGCTPKAKGSWGNAPDVSFTLFDGQAKKLSDFAGKPIVLNYWAAW